jgi:RNA polymerase sigma-70 factor (ECF subfamily)
MITSAIPESDESLAAEALGPGPGRQSALGELLERHAESLHRFFALQFRDRSLAEDLVQEVFERVVRARERFRPGHDFKPWLWTIARNLARSVRRSQRAAPGMVSLEATESPEEVSLSDRLANEAPSPRRRLAERERSERLWNAIESLDDGLQDVVLLKHFQELPSQEIAAILGVPVGTVWSRLHRALVQLREILGPDLSVKGGEPT